MKKHSNISPPETLNYPSLTESLGIW